MKYNNLEVPRQAIPRRPGRGIAAGRGKTAGRGTKGQGARKSGGVRPGFEGGQMPLYMRLPKLRGFKSHAPAVEVVYTGQLGTIKKAVIDNQAIFEAGLTSTPFVKVKLIVNGELSSKKDVKLQLASKSAVELVTKAGGSFTSVDQVGRQKKQDAKSNKQ
ncbi:50S ribosomal protein L15 [Candidatus Saccharibacteria bacterium]|nr:50S ribosomal protein L15 [Candidatus Saccharibacteria bacterium]